jgi:peptide-methionine (S)-S-oxide reductase
MIHSIFNLDLDSPTPTDHKEIILGAGCFWGVERRLWNLQGVRLTSVGYAGGTSINPSYEEVCYGSTGHAEVVKVVFDPVEISLKEILISFWEMHDPTQGMRQGNDIGSQYRSVIYTNNEEDLNLARTTLETYQQEISRAGFGPITTELKVLNDYYLAEEYHQQYLQKNPNGYCGIGGIGCSFPEQ